MINIGVNCDVKSCVHHAGQNQCKLALIDVTCEKTGPQSMNMPHFCKSFEQK